MFRHETSDAYQHMHVVPRHRTASPARTLPLIRDIGTPLFNIIIISHRILHYISVCTIEVESLNAPVRATTARTRAFTYSPTFLVDAQTHRWTEGDSYPVGLLIFFTRSLK